MNEESIKVLVKAGILRPRQPDIEKIKSIVSFAGINAEIAKQVALNEKSATLIFREIYESIRQLGDAKWWLLGYEPGNHEISLDILKDFDIKDKVKFNFLDRFKSIRHDANYRGFIVKVSQAEEIIDFWDRCGKEVKEKLEREVK